MTAKEKRAKYVKMYEKMWKDGYITESGKVFLKKELREIESRVMELDTMDVSGMDEVIEALDRVKEFYE